MSTSESRFQSLYDALPVGILVVDELMKITYLNRTLLNWSRLNPSELIGKDIFATFTNINHVKYIDRIKQTLESGTPALFSTMVNKYIVPCPYKDGFRHQDVTVTNYISESGRRFLIFTLLDVTEYHSKVIEMNRLSKMKDKLLAVCSHDLKAPLNVIMGFVSIVFEDDHNKKQHGDAYYHIQNASKIMVNFINDLLDLGRVNLGKSKQGATYLGPLVRDSINSLNLLAYKKNISINFVNHLKNDGPINGNPSDLIRVFNNLLSNAIKFTPHQGEIVFEMNQSGPEAITLSIRDSGQGIPAEKLPKLFAVYSGVSSTGTSGEKGTGLGLSIVKDIVEQHFGTILVESVLGKGTLFKITLPMRKETSTPIPIPNQQKQEALPMKDRQKTILIVDDEMSSTTLTRAYLKTTNHTTLAVANGMAALDLLQKRDVDLILLDMSMPEMDGFETIMALRKSEQERHVPHIPVVALTAYSSQEEVDRAMKLGCNAYLTKPIDREQLLSTIAQY